MLTVGRAVGLREGCPVGFGYVQLQWIKMRHLLEDRRFIRNIMKCKIFLLTVGEGVGGGVGGACRLQKLASKQYIGCE